MKGWEIWCKQFVFFFSAIRNGNIEALVRMPIHQPGFHGSKPHRGFETVNEKKGDFFQRKVYTRKTPSVLDEP